MSVKDQIADKFRAAGYDFMTAYEEATRCMREFLDSGDKRQTIHIVAGHRIVDTFILARK